ncbi:MAG: membrane protein insertase YidC [Bacteriovoracaceae bacterium]|nr:membrane protein insertase YidC [Bacteriovoracaceae bacterium]
MNDSRRFLLAIGLSVLVFVVWNHFFTPPPPVPMDNQSPATAPTAVAVASSTTPAPTAELAAAKPQVQQAIFTIKNNNASYTINENLQIVDAQALHGRFPFADIVGSNPPVQLFLVDEQRQLRPLNFVWHAQASGSGENYLSGVDHVSKIKVNAFIDDAGFLHFQLHGDTLFKIQVQWKVPEEKFETGMMREYVYLTTSDDRLNVGSSKSIDGKMRWFGVDYRYHFFGIIFPDRLGLRAEILKDGTAALGLLDPYQDLDLKFIFTKKNYDDLVALGDQLDQTVNFGMFSFLSIPILRCLQLFYGWIHNYGVAIIFLTILIRLLTFPLQYKSYKSMKRMQDLSPEIAKIKEKFKDEPQRLQQETMALFKQSGANPLGGCLPLLLQMPIFFAFYRVLYSAVELVDAPFIFYIHDLSSKDPYYVLPLLMGLAMFVQQKMTPSPTADNKQKKIMLLMPVVFTFIMANFAAGLNLYIFVSTIFGIFQQKLVYKAMEREKARALSKK